jgi:2-dehydro-3-deoxyphosphogluconate aldolase/(4S)-4-hydroxy-2-oxoglutarate aldolase
MTRNTVRQRIEQIGIIPAVRTASAEDARFAAEAVAEAGIPIVEITMTVPGALDVIAGLIASHPHLVVGVGTILDVGTARRALDAGAHFVTSPGFDCDVVEAVRQADVLVIPGALTPTEVTAAWEARADLVKVFPCGPFGGASYFKSLIAPFPQVPFVASGGINQQTAPEFVLAGALAIGVGKALIPPRAVKRRQADWIGELARRFVTIVREARNLPPDE